MSSVKKNFIYSSILTASNYIFPLITYPYVSRVLGVTNIGICNYIDSIINYFILFSMMGIAATGIREIAANKDNPKGLNTVFSSLLLLNGIFTLFAFCVLLIVMFTVPSLIEYRKLLWIGAVKLIANALLFEWLYKGVEDFKYITQRTIIIKLLYVISVFVFIHKSDDYPVYFLLTALMVVVNAVVNCIYSRKFVRVTKEGITITPFIKSYLVIGFFLILNSFYTSFNVAYLGFITSPTEVGYYTTATKVFSVVIAVYSAFSGVMLPRMSALRSQGKTEEFLLLIRKSVSALLAFAIPMVALFSVFSPDVIDVFAGKGYEGAYTPARIVMPLVFIVGYEQILVMQILMPMKKDRAIFVNSVIGASTGLIFNFLLVNKLGATGSSIVWLVSELSVLICAQHFVTKFIGYRFPWLDVLKNIISYFPLLLLCIIVECYCHNMIIRLLLAGAIVVFYSYGVQKLVLRNEIFLSIVDNTLIKLHIKK